MKHLSPKEKQDFGAFSPLVKLRGSLSLWVGVMLHLSTFDCVDCLLKSLPQPCRVLANYLGQAQNLLRPKHKICSSLVPTSGCDEHPRKTHGEIRSLKNNTGFWHCEHQAGLGASPTAKREEYGIAAHHMSDSWMRQ